jgi:hypothetical protein
MKLLNDSIYPVPKYRFIRYGRVRIRVEDRDAMRLVGE